MGSGPNKVILNIRFGVPQERTVLEELQRRASLVWEEYRVDLLTHPDAIQLPLSQLLENRVRVAEMNSRRVGFSVVIPKSADVSELDGLFVDRVPRRGVAYLGHRRFRHQFEPIMPRVQPRA